VAACTNATAAAAAWYAGNHRSEMVLRTTLPGAETVDAQMRVCESRPGGPIAVEQSWSRISLTVQVHTQSDGRSVATCVGPLNNYIIVQARRTDDLSAFSVPEALAFWRRCGLTREPLVSRLAVVQAADDGRVMARFFTCGEREHPSAPLTGLAVLALAWGQLDWPALRQRREVSTPLGTMILPRVRTACDGTATVEFSPLLVNLAIPVRS
jgi:hypothetical protein